MLCSTRITYLTTLQVATQLQGQTVPLEQWGCFCSSLTPVRKPLVHLFCLSSSLRMSLSIYSRGNQCTTEMGEEDLVLSRRSDSIWDLWTCTEAVLAQPEPSKGDGSYALITSGGLSEACRGHVYLLVAIFYQCKKDLCVCVCLFVYV